MQGIVNSKYEIAVYLKLRGNAKVLEVEAIVDTGYNSYLTLPTELIQQLDLESESESFAVLADGTSCRIGVYSADIEWDGVWKKIFVSAVGDETLLGMRLLAGHKLSVDVVPGGLVSIEPRN